jgi:hypothetical protein
VNSFTPANSRMSGDVSADGSSNLIDPYNLSIGQPISGPFPGTGSYIHLVNDPSLGGGQAVSVGVFGIGSCVAPQCSRIAAESLAAGVWTVVPEVGTAWLVLTCFVWLTIGGSPHRSLQQVRSPRHPV